MIHIVCFIVLCLNSSPATIGILEHFSLSGEIVTGKELKFDVHFKYQIGEYYEACEDPNITNTNRSHTYPGSQVRKYGEARALPEKEAQQFYHVTSQLLFMSHGTRCDCKSLPLPI